ncbi:hypothetical protein TRVL_07729 [Trypanosoma vivax]|nr:hypothetical protein TRVL_07729 [Trypanosoma vivax]
MRHSCLKKGKDRVKPDNAAVTALHYDTLRQLVMEAFPVASIYYIIPPGTAGQQNGTFVNGTTDTVMQRLRGRLNSGAKELTHAHAPLSHSECSPTKLDNGMKARRGPFRDCCSSSGVERWRALYRSFPPKLFGGRAVWREEHEDAASPVLPCWSPHAVVYIDGFEAPDLRRVVAPRLFKLIPPFKADDEWNRTVGGATVDHSRINVPKFAAKTLNADFLLREKGCMLHEPDMLELSMPVFLGPERTGRAWHGRPMHRRIATFVSFASCEPNAVALNRLEDPGRRIALRTAFGFSLAALKYSLPPPVVGATRLLRQWNAKWSETPLSVAFWLSAVGHAVNCGIGTNAFHSKSNGAPLDKGEVDHNRQDEARFLGDLAASAASLVDARCADCKWNYFLPPENFEQERGVNQLLNSAQSLPLEQLRDVVMP